MSDQGPDEPPAEGPEDPQSHLRIIPPDPVPDEDGGVGAPEPASPPTTAATGRPRVRVFSDEDPARMPLPAMGPGSGGSRLPDESDDDATATHTMEMPVAGDAAQTSSDADAQPTEPEAEPSEPEPEVAEPEPEVAEAEPTEPEDVAAGSEPEVAEAEPSEPEDVAAGSEPEVAEAEPTEPEDVAAGSDAEVSGSAGATGVEGVRLDRSDTGEIIKVSADQIPREPDTEAANGTGAAVVAAPAPGTPEPAASGESQRRPNPLTKVATGIAFGVVALVFILLGRSAFAALAGVLIVWGAAEFYAALHQSVAKDEETPGSAVAVLSQHPAAIVSVVAVAAMVATTYFFGIEALGATTAAALVAAVLWFVPDTAVSQPPRDATLNSLGIVHVGVAGCFAMLILRLEHGFALLLVVVILTVVSDIAAYAWGTTLGHTPFFQSVSPNKSLEGFLGAVATTIAAGLIVTGLQGWLYPSVPALASWGQMFALALLIAVAAAAGDLSESLFKRELGIKDVASFLPGHGGMLDRLDGMLFALPVAYVFFVAMGMADVG